MIINEIIRDINWQRRMHRVILLFVFMLFCLTAVAQENDSLAVVPVKTSIEPVVWEQVDYRIPTEEQIAKYQNDSRFQYGHNFFMVNVISYITNLINRLIITLLQGSSESGAINVLVYVIPAILLILLIVFIILKAKNIKLRSLFGKKKLDTPEIDFYTEDVNEMNFETLIESALKNKNYRLVIRFLYLRNLKTLSDNRLIKWNINKTNLSYQYEITNVQMRKEFIDITFIFDYVWYGEFAVDEDQYTVVANKMKSFNNLATNG